MEYIKYSWKSIIAGFGTAAATLLENYQGEIVEWVAAAVAGAIVGGITWLKGNGPKP